MILLHYTRLWLSAICVAKKTSKTKSFFFQPKNIQGDLWNFFPLLRQLLLLYTQMGKLFSPSFFLFLISCNFPLIYTSFIFLPVFFLGSHFHLISSFRCVKYRLISHKEWLYKSIWNIDFAKLFFCHNNQYK